jgi:serine/threonine-protein kinase BUR1
VEVKKVAPSKRKEPVRRTREEEKDAYGRVFMGCGQQSDYELMTKVGEGTFGYAFLFLNGCF